MNMWFIGLILYFTLELGHTLAKHGEVRQGKFNFGASLVVVLLFLFVLYKAIQAGF